jgi:hypothetical protein
MKYFILETVSALLWKLCGRLVVDFCNSDRENKSLWNLLARIKCFDNLAIYLKRNIPKWRECGLGEVSCLPPIRAFQRMIVDWWENARNPVQWCFNHLFSRISESSIAKIQGWTRGLATHMDFCTPCGVFSGCGLCWRHYDRFCCAPWGLWKVSTDQTFTGQMNISGLPVKMAQFHESLFGCVMYW